jgi:predicted RNA-binding protein (virulence factor B family)
MLEIGKYNYLTVVKEVPFGMYLESDQGEILLPTNYIPVGTEVGDEIKVFVYKDSEDRLIATNWIPKATVGEFACLMVKDVNEYGAFMDWGLVKDLMVPYKEQHIPMKKGQEYVVRVCLDPKNDRIIGVSKLAAFLSKDASELSEGQEVDLMIYEFTDLGIMALVNNKFKGMLYKNEVFSQLKVGQKLKGYIKKIREDHKIDLTLYKTGYDSVLDSKDVILNKIKLKGGFLRLTDNSSPEEIKSELEMSKKTYKKAVGGLLKEGLIELSPEGIKLKKG